jgi:hypothetical protein
MASTRNNKLQERRAALREQQKREREAADAAFKALDDEYDAKVTAAQAVASVVELSGKERAAILLDLETRDVAAYVKYAEDAASGETAEGTGEQGGGGSGASNNSAVDGAESGKRDETAGQSKAAAEVPAQGERATAAASV